MSLDDVNFKICQTATNGHAVLLYICRSTVVTKKPTAVKNNVTFFIECKIYYIISVSDSMARKISVGTAEETCQNFPYTTSYSKPTSRNVKNAFSVESFLSWDSRIKLGCLRIPLLAWTKIPLLNYLLFKNDPQKLQKCVSYGFWVKFNRKDCNSSIRSNFWNFYGGHKMVMDHWWKDLSLTNQKSFCLAWC